MISAARKHLRSNPRWLQLRELQREGFVRAWRRWRIQRAILSTPVVQTDTKGDIEVRVLTWRRDWVNLIWALKSFYHFSQVGYPLHIHDGGLLPGQGEALLRHFPKATIVDRAAADRSVVSELRRRNLNRSAEYRQLNPASRKVFDYAVLSGARRIIGIDSDIVFFARPSQLLDPEDHISRFNRDIAYGYSLDPTEVSALCGRLVPTHINSGLFAVDLASLDLGLVETWLAEPKLFDNRWVTEQTLHAMLAARYGVEVLPDCYLTDIKPGLPPGTLCKHYPGFERPWLYAEGMRRAVELGLTTGDWACGTRQTSTRFAEAH